MTPIKAVFQNICNSITSMQRLYRRGLVGSVPLMQYISRTFNQPHKQQTTFIMMRVEFND